MVKSILKKIRETPDDEIRDDDHLDRKDISREEFKEGLKEIFDEKKENPDDEPSEAAKAALKTLRKNTKRKPGE